MTPYEFPLTTDEPQPDLGQVLEDLLGRLPVGLARAIRLGAIPHRLNPKLLGLLTGSPENTAGYLSEMMRLGLLSETDGGWLIYPGQLRTHLLARLQNELEIYRPASAQLARYFLVQVERKENPTAERDRLEYIYHQFAADETIGLAQLRHDFNDFRQSNQEGIAAQMLNWVAEQQAVLSQTGQNWLRYYKTLLRPASLDLKKSLATLQELAAQASDPLLLALIQRSLGEILAQNRQWTASVREFQIALQGFQHIGDIFETANTQTGLGAIYISLAESAGGLRDEFPQFDTRLKRWLYYLQLAPFLMYRWFSRRFAFVPNLYFGSDYQNWIIIRYLYGAIDWLTRAEKNLGHKSGREEPEWLLARLQIRIRLADLYQKIGRWSQAEKIFTSLYHDPSVQATPYLLGLVQLGRGSIRLAHGALDLALENLRISQTIFRQCGDLNSAGKAARLIAQAYFRKNQIAEAIFNYREASEAFQATNDLLNATETLIRAQTLSERLPDSQRASLQMGELSEKLPQQAYMERFPDHSGGYLHRVFRGIVAYLVFPITFIQIIAIALFQMLLVATAELFFKAMATSQAPQLTLLADLATALPFLLLAPLLVFWTYEALYAIAGALVARVLPIRLFTHQQPVYFVIDQEALGRYDQNGQLTDFLPWSEATIAISLDRRIGPTPLTLFSRFVIANGEKTLIVDGILNRYLLFKDEARKRLQAQARQIQFYTLDVALFNRPWLSATLAVVLLIVAITIFLKFTSSNNAFLYVLSPSGITHTLYITDIAFQFWRWLIRIGPWFALVQLLYKRQVTRRLFGEKVPMDVEWPIWLALLILTLITLGELRLLFS